MDDSTPSPAASPQSSQEPDSQQSLPCCYKSYLLIENPSKSNNLGPILRCAAAYAVSEVIFVGYQQCSTEGSHGSARHLRITAFPTFEQATTHLRQSEGEGGCGVADIVGLLCGETGAYSDEGCGVGENAEKNLVVIGGSKGQETTYPRSMPVYTRPFQRGNVAFLVSKNWRGLPVDQASYCDSFLHVPHVPIMDCDPDSDKEGELAAPLSKGRRMLIDVQSCLSIALHHYTAWAKYDERAFEGQKFEVKTFRRGERECVDCGGREAKANARAEARAEKAAEAVIDGGCFNDMYGAEDY